MRYYVTTDFFNVKGGSATRHELYLTFDCVEEALERFEVECKRFELMQENGERPEDGYQFVRDAIGKCSEVIVSLYSRVEGMMAAVGRRSIWF